MSERFEGYYHKHQKDGVTLCLIVGLSGAVPVFSWTGGSFRLRIAPYKL